MIVEFLSNSIDRQREDAHVTEKISRAHSIAELWELSDQIHDQRRRKLEAICDAIPVMGQAVLWISRNW